MNCMECEYHKLKCEVGKPVMAFCYGGLRPKAKPFRKSERQLSTPMWCPKKRREKMRQSKGGEDG